MSARGYFGGDAFKKLLVVDINFPTHIRLRIDGEKFTRNVGNKVATAIRKRLKLGLNAAGEEMPRPLQFLGSGLEVRSGEALKRTGELIDSIKYRKDTGMISPSTSVRTTVSSRVRSNFGLMAVHIAGVYQRRGVQPKHTRPPIGDPMGAESQSTVDEIEKASAAELKRQLASGECGLLLELKRSFKSGRLSR